eukprot:7790006-Prorocentrum_lima.AAC.1
MCAELAKYVVPHHGLWSGFLMEAHEGRDDVEQVLPTISYHKAPIVVGWPGDPCSVLARAN